MRGEEYPATVLCDLLHLEGAQAISAYEEDFYAGMPVLTRNQFGQGEAYYVATRSDHAFYRKYIRNLCGGIGNCPGYTRPRME